MATGLSVDLKASPAILAPVAIFAAGAWFYSRIRPDAGLANALSGLIQLLLIVLICAVLTYPAAKAGFPYRDASLYQLDQWLGFDRAAYLRAFTDQPWKQKLSDSVYLSMLPEMAVIPLVLILARRTERFQRFIAAYGLALVLTSAIFIFMPAVGALVFIDLPSLSYAELPSYARTLDALRRGEMTTISLLNIEGFITFPSFHTQSAILYTWALWPIKWVRWPAVLLNVAIISTTPVSGAHYAVDVIAGALLVVPVIVLSRKLCEDFSVPLADEKEWSARQHAGARISTAAAE
ncbi:phosphatase PAP2 family protein [Nitrobacter sp.]|uniref:phosphatase PAP2 family protein n=1 Tax=Nitrobacter sp. TaxID=29420 RepID=UPI00399D6038